MGLLQHVVLPAFGLLHAAGGFMGCKDLTSWAGMVGLPAESVNEFDERSVRQNHMLGCLRGFNLSLFVLCGVGVFCTTSTTEFRKQVVLAEGVLFATAAVDAYRQGTLNYWVPTIQTVVALLAGVFGK